MTAEQTDEDPDVTAERIHRGGYNPTKEDVDDRSGSRALPPGWASRQASQPDPHMIREK